MDKLSVRRFPLGLLLIVSVVGAQETAGPQPAQAGLDLTPFAGTGPRAELVPVLAGDKALVTSTLRLFAFDAATGARSWAAGPPEGWDALSAKKRDSLFQGLDPAALWIAPAAGKNVAVAALQIPQTKTTSEQWQAIEISRSLPERRLFAFELATGKPLWNHAPPADWDGTSGSFPQRMNVIGAPLVVGEHVLVPCASDAADVDYQVACYELGSGSLSWSTHVVDGRLERNMFGHACHEFAAAPLALDSANGRVIAQTGFGVVAALDLTTGALRWRVEYEPIPRPRAHSYSTPRRQTVWRTTPPLIAGNALLATPRDSAELLALDLADGHRLWSVTAQALQELDPHTKTLGFDQLIGAAPDTLYLGGQKVSAFQKPHGLASSEPFFALWTRELKQPRERGRAQIAGDELLVPSPDESLAVLDRGDGHTRSSSVIRELAGLVAADPALFVLAGGDLRRIER